jgi:hypothetical protein
MLVEVVGGHLAQDLVERVLEIGVALATEMPMLTSSSETLKSSLVLAEKSRIFMIGVRLITAACAVGISVQTKSTVPVSSAISMAGADSDADWILASLICGRQVSYQMVPSWEVQVPPEIGMPLAEANLLFLSQADDRGVEVRAGEVDLLARSAVMDWPAMMASMVAGLDGGDQGIPVETLDLELPAVGLAELLGHHDVVAVGVFGGGVLDGHGAVGVVGLRPVVRACRRTPWRR